MVGHGAGQFARWTGPGWCALVYQSNGVLGSNEFISNPDAGWNRIRRRLPSACRGKVLQIELLMRLIQDVGLRCNQTTVTACVLAVSILLHPLLTYLATPLVNSHGDGQRIVLCTLQGEQTRFVDFNSGQDEPESCPALKLLQVIGTGSVAVPPFVPGRQLYASVSVGTSVDYPYLAPHFAFFPSRAPPLS